MIDFEGSQFEREIILWGVRWYGAYPINYRQLEEMMLERGVSVDHSTLNRWVITYVPELEKQFRRRQGLQISCRVMSGQTVRQYPVFPSPHARVRAILRNPGFTDAYVYSKTEQHIRGRLWQDGSGPLKAARRPPDEWVVIRHHHASYPPVGGVLEQSGAYARQLKHAHSRAPQRAGVSEPSSHVRALWLSHEREVWARWAGNSPRTVPVLCPQLPEPSVSLRERLLPRPASPLRRAADPR